MKYLTAFCLLGLIGCAQHRGPASVEGQKVAYNSMALGNVKASATKSIQDNDVCFDVDLVLKGVESQDASAANWTLAWVDQNSQYHLLSTNQRDPASEPKGGNVIAPYGAYQEWSNNFKTCVSKINPDDVKSLVLTPKNLPFNNEKSLHLNWN
ncbi:MAG TPA: hypothetical protein VNJ01_08380 [Bacteriovoracaceae bacterium]|nr:hypothetical protein [Bacteriovoracaceae bacterium]